MKLSIVTSYYNSEKYIKEQSSSILSQSYGNWEWIIADDFSKDNTKQKLIELQKKDSRIRLVNLSRKKELWWNPQLFATGDIVCHVDGDDALLPGTFERLKYYFEKFPEVVLLHFNANKYKEELPKTKNDLFENFVNNVYISKDNKSFLEGFERLCSQRSGIFGYLRVFRNIKNLRFTEHSDDSDCSSNDGQWLLNLEEKGKTLTIPRTSYLAREHYDSENFRNWNIKGEVKLIEDAKKRRKNIYLSMPRKIDYFDDIYEAAESTYISSLNWENSSKSISFLNFNYSEYELIKLKDLFFEHSVSFDKNNADYVFIRVNPFDSPESIVEKVSKVNSRSELVVFCDNCHLQNNNRTGVNNLEELKKLLSSKIKFNFVFQENRAYFVKANL